MKNSTKPNEVIHVLGNKYRYAIAEILLQKSEVGVTQIISGLHKKFKAPISQPAVSQHLNKMRIKGIVSNRRDARQIFYRLEKPATVQFIIHHAKLHTGA